VSTRTGLTGTVDRSRGRGGDAVQARHADVHQDDVGPQGAQPLDGFMAADALGHDVEPVRRGEDSRQAGTDDRLVVDERHPDHRVTPSATGTASLASSGSVQVTSQPSGVGPAVSSPPSADARSRIPISP
jgi:hypothetical protein